MQITISKGQSYDEQGKEIKGYHISVSSQTGKKTVQDSDFFADGSEIENKVQQLHQILKKYFGPDGVADA